MCSRYEAPSSQRLLEAFQVTTDEPTQTELWPTYVGPFLRESAGEEGDGAPEQRGSPFPGSCLWAGHGDLSVKFRGEA